MIMVFLPFPGGWSWRREEKDHEESKIWECRPGGGTPSNQIIYSSLRHDQRSWNQAAGDQEVRGRNQEGKRSRVVEAPSLYKRREQGREFDFRRRSERLCLCWCKVQTQILCSLFIFCHLSGPVYHHWPTPVRNIGTWDEKMILQKQNPSLSSSFLGWNRCQESPHKFSKSGHCRILRKLHFSILKKRIFKRLVKIDFFRK